MGIYVWGTGCGASELIEQGLAAERITAFVDSFPSGETFLGRPVLLPEALTAAECDLVIVTARQAEAIARRCAELGIQEEKVLYMKNCRQLADRNAPSLAAARALLGEELLRRLLPRHRIVPTPAQLAESGLGEDVLGGDYVRLATLELLCRRVKDIPGDTAELGVYKGFFASCINRLLPDRRLYLFDSFESFAPEAGASEAFQAAHANTSVSRVLSGMPHPEQVTVKPGYFPGSLQGLETRFALVSLDVDFGETTLEGLRWFWPRLNPGGYLLLHDWGSPALPEVAEALRQYERELGEPLRGVPLCDVAGSLILCK